MNLNDAKCLEYTISLFREFLVDYSRNQGRQNNLPTYRLVWRMNGSLVSGDLLVWSTEHGLPIVHEVTSNFQIVENLLSFQSNDTSKFPSNVRDAWFKRYTGPFNNPMNLYKKPALLLQNSINFVNGLENKQLQTVNPIMHNVHYLENNAKLEFLMLDPNIDLQPVSLISISEN